MHAQVDHARRQVQVVVQVVFFGRGHVARVAQGPFHKSARGLRRLHAQRQILDVVQGIEDPKDIDTTLIGLLAELVNYIVRVGRVADAVRPPQQHLEGDVRCEFSELF